MTRIVIVGNSHVGALKTGWDAVKARHPDHSVTFFAVPSGDFRKLTLDSARILAVPAARTGGEGALIESLERINGRAAVALGAADFVLQVGRHPIAQPIAELLASYAIDEVRDVGARRRMSRAMFEACCADIARRALPRPEWRGWERPRLMLLQPPAPAEAITASGDEKRRPWKRLLARPDGALFGFGLAWDRLEAELEAIGIGLLRQPAETLAASGMTKDCFARGSSRLSGGLHREQDVRHMNAAYGALCLETYFAQIETASRMRATELT